MRLYYLTFRAMGSRVSLQLETDGDGAAYLEAAVHQIEILEACLTRFRPDSDLMCLNARAGEWVEVNPILFEAVGAAKHAAFITDGLYHPLLLDVMIGIGYDRSFEIIESNHQPSRTGIILDWREIRLRHQNNEVYIPVGSALDLGGIGKGWAADRVADDLSVYGACLVNLGGDIAARGKPEGYLGWPVDVTDPHDDSLLVSLWLSDMSIATSGKDYRRWKSPDGAAQHHLIDPRTGSPAQTDVETVTVIHPNGASAETFAKAILIQGAQPGLTWLTQHWDCAAMVVKTDGEVIATANFTPYLTQSQRGQ
jgi:thiamine biosynthesis lipoprotein